jgi:hypothetical protein
MSSLLDIDLGGAHAYPTHTPSHLPRSPRFRLRKAIQHDLPPANLNSKLKYAND